LYKKDVRTFGMLIIDCIDSPAYSFFTKKHFMLVKPRIISERSSKTNSSFLDDSRFFQHKLLVYVRVYVLDKYTQRVYLKVNRSQNAKWEWFVLTFFTNKTISIDWKFNYLQFFGSFSAHPQKSLNLMRG